MSFNWIFIHYANCHLYRWQNRSLLSFQQIEWLSVPGWNVPLKSMLLLIPCDLWREKSRKAINFSLSNYVTGSHKLPNNSSGCSGRRKSTFPVVGLRGCKCIWWLENSPEGWFIRGGLKPGPEIAGTVCWSESPITLTPFKWPAIINNQWIRIIVNSNLWLQRVLMFSELRTSSICSKTFQKFSYNICKELVWKLIQKLFSELFCIRYFSQVLWDFPSIDVNKSFLNCWFITWKGKLFSSHQSSHFRMHL